LNQITEPSNFGFEFGIFAFVIVDLNELSFLIHEIDALVILAIQRQRSQISEVELDDIIAESSHDFPFSHSYGSFQEDDGLGVSCAFPHFVHLEEGVFGDEKCFEMEKKSQVSL